MPDRDIQVSDVSPQEADVDRLDTEAFYRRHFTVYNPAGTVGVSWNGRGEFARLFLEEDALSSDEQLAAEIVVIARLAQAKYRMQLRLFSLECVEAQGRNPDRVDRFLYRGLQKLPTPDEYQEMESAEFARMYPL